MTPPPSNWAAHRKPSITAAEEREKLNAYFADLAACPPANSVESATKLRAVLVKHHPHYGDFFKSLDLPFA